LQQTYLSFDFSVDARVVRGFRYRYSQGRQLVDKIRQAIGSIQADAKSTEFAYLVGRKAEPNGGDVLSLPNVQSSNLISKWHVTWDQNNPEAHRLGGQIRLILEECFHDLEHIKGLLLMAGAKAGVTLKAVEAGHDHLDAEVDGEQHYYHISNFYPLLRHIAQDKRKAEFPYASDPEALKVLSASTGSMVKRHLIELAEERGLNAQVIKTSPLIVSAQWVTRPSKNWARSQKNHFYEGSIDVEISAPYKLSGFWFAGGLRHKNSGSINSRPPRSRMRKGVFVL